MTFLKHKLRVEHASHLIINVLTEILLLVVVSFKPKSYLVLKSCGRVRLAIGSGKCMGWTWIQLHSRITTVVSWIFWLHFCTAGGSGDASSHLFNIWACYITLSTLKKIIAKLLTIKSCLRLETKCGLHVAWRHLKGPSSWTLMKLPNGTYSVVDRFIMTGWLTSSAITWQLLSFLVPKRTCTKLENGKWPSTNHSA